MRRGKTWTKVSVIYVVPEILDIESLKRIKHASTIATGALHAFTNLKLDLHIGEPMQICIHRKDNSPKPVNHRLTLKEGPKVKSNIRRFLAQDLV